MSTPTFPYMFAHRPTPVPMIPSLKRGFLGEIRAEYYRNSRRKGWATYCFSVRRLVEAVWVVVLWWGERRVFTSAIEQCQWDNWEDWPAGATPHRMVLIADPQLVDPHTYPRRGALLAATIFYTDKYMARSYEELQNRLAPSTTVFLGDLFDGGREWSHEQSSLYARQHHLHEDALPITADPRAESDWGAYNDDYWMREYRRFQRVFPSWPYRRTVKALPGNHDIGIGLGVREGVRDRFSTYFGETSGVLVAGNHTLVMVDSVSLSNEDSPKIYTPVRDFLDGLSDVLAPPPSFLLPHVIETTTTPPTQPPPPPSPPPPQHQEQNPTILFTHVPLYRPSNTPCGPLRESPISILPHAGYQYQNVLTAPLSAELLLKTRAKHVFSADDHDFCDVLHAGLVREVTVKSFSWAMGIRRPGFYMVSLYTGHGDSTSGSNGVQGRLCLLPDQYGVFWVYASMFGVTVLAAAVEFERRRRVGQVWVGGGKGSEILPLANSRDEDGDEVFKYAKRRPAVAPWKARAGWVLKEVLLVALVVLVWYFWLIWRW